MGRRFCLRGAAMFLGAMAMALSPAGPASPVSFSRDVAPILGRHCLSCHGATTQLMSLLDLRTRAGMLIGGQKGGPAIIPGNAAGSPIYRRITGREQPAMMRR